MIDFARVLQDRDVTPGSTWLRSDNTEMLVILPGEDTVIRKLLEKFESVHDNVPSADEPGWVRVARLPVNGKAFTRIDVVFVPYLCGQIDKGLLARIG